MVSRIEVLREDVALVLVGDARSIERIVRALERPFYVLASRMSLSAEDAEEATQEALLLVCTHLAQFDGRAQFSTWAWRIAANQCVDHRANRRTLSVLSSESISEQMASGLDLEVTERTEDRAVLNERKASDRANDGRSLAPTKTTVSGARIDGRVPTRRSRAKKFTGNQIVHGDVSSNSTSSMEE